MSRVECHILIRTGREAVLTAVRHIEAYPCPMGGIESVTVLNRTEEAKIVNSEWLASIPKPSRKLTWTQEELWKPEQAACSFRQIVGDFDEFSGRWSFTEVELGLTRFDIVVDYRFEIPIIGGFYRSAIQEAIEGLMASFQKGIKDRCEGRV